MSENTVTDEAAPVYGGNVFEIDGQPGCWLSFPDAVSDVYVYLDGEQIDTLTGETARVVRRVVMGMANHGL